MHNLLSVTKSLSDKTRLRILNLLSVRDFSVWELQKALNMSEPRISRHVHILNDAGLIVRRKEGRHFYYSLNKAGNRADLFLYLQACFTIDPAFGKDKIASENIAAPYAVQR